MNPIAEIEPLFAAAGMLPEPGAAPVFGSASLAPLPALESLLRLRHLERNSLTSMVVDLERMIEEPHPTRAICPSRGLRRANSNGTKRTTKGSARWRSNGFRFA